MYLYHIRFSSAKETFEKIGITKNSPQERFGSEFYKGYELKILELIKGEPQYIRALEKKLLCHYSEISYLPLKENFSGKTECFEAFVINIKNPL